MSAPIGDDDRRRAQVACLVLLRQHPILGLEVMSGVGDKLPVAWMIDGFDSDDDPHQLGIMLADVLDQLGFGIGRPGNENRAGVGDRLRDRLKKGVILRGVPTPDGVCLVVDVLGRTIRVQHEPFHISRAEMEHACLMVIDPNDRCLAIRELRLNSALPLLRNSRRPPDQPGPCWPGGNTYRAAPQLAAEEGAVHPEEAGRW
jgi:hypothetical protein